MTTPPNQPDEDRSDLDELRGSGSGGHGPDDDAMPGGAVVGEAGLGGGGVGAGDLGGGGDLGTQPDDDEDYPSAGGESSG